MASSIGKHGSLICSGFKFLCAVYGKSTCVMCIDPLCTAGDSWDVLGVHSHFRKGNTGPLLSSL